MSETLLAGDEVANHLILRVLEREACGWVYLAEDPDGARVRLRVMSEDALSDENVRARVLQDLATLQALEHPNLSRFLGYGEDEAVFYSLEHNGNATLFDLVYHRRALNGEELLWVARGLVSALSVLHEAGIPHGQLGATSIVLRDDGPVLVDLGLDARLDPAYDPDEASKADMRALQQVLGFAASGPGTDSGDETQALDAGPARLINTLAQVDSIGDAVEAIDRLVEDSAKTGIDTQPALDDFMSLLEASDYSSGVYRRLDVPKPDVTEQVLPVSSVEGDPLGDSDPGLDSDSGTVAAVRADLMTSHDVMLRDDSGRHVPLVDAPAVSQEGMFESEERTPLVDAETAYPRRLGDYVLLEEIGSGLGGTVHLARAKEAQNLVALRTLKPKLLEREEDLQKLWRKADATASLAHPVFARTLDRGEVDGEAFLVTELVAGRNLEELSAQGVDVERGLLPQLLPVLDAVAEANEAGIVDGNLRASHIVIDGEGRPRLLDFGLGPTFSKRKGRELGFGLAQAKPKGESNDDVESAALLVYHVATRGKTPPSGGWRVTLLGDPVPPSAFVSGLRPELDAVVAKSLAGESGARYPTVSALREDLERVLAGGVPVAQPIPSSRRAALWVVAQPLLSAVLAVWVVCTVVFFCMAMFGGGGTAPVTETPAVATGLDPEQVEAERRRSMAEALCEAADQLYRDGNPHAAVGPYGQALLLVPELEQARDGLEKAKRAITGIKEERSEAELEATLAIQDALSAIDEGDADTARRALDKAADMQRLLLDTSGAEQGDAELTTRLRRLEADLARMESAGSGAEGDPQAVERAVQRKLEQAAQAALEARREQAVALTQQGDAALASDDKSAASEHYLDALALDPEHAGAREGLRSALTTEPTGAGADTVAKWAVDQRESLRADAERARSRGEHKRAEERLLQALAFAPRDPQLQAALEDVRAHLRSESSAPVGERVNSAVKRGEAALERARTATDRGQAALSYLTAQGELSAALALDPNRSDLAGELSKIKEEAVELFTPQAAAEAAPTRPDDPHLQFEEADQIAIARALGRKVRFAPPGNVFAELRDEVETLGKGRFRAFLRLRTRAERIPQGSLQSVRVVARGFEVQLEDKKERVRWPWKFLAFEDGPYPRATRVERDGTVVISPFFSAQQSATASELARLRALLLELIDKALEEDAK